MIANAVLPSRFRLRIFRGFSSVSRRPQEIFYIGNKLSAFWDLFSHSPK